MIDAVNRYLVFDKGGIAGKKFKSLQIRHRSQVGIGVFYHLGIFQAGGKDRFARYRSQASTEFGIGKTTFYKVAKVELATSLSMTKFMRIRQCWTENRFEEEVRGNR